VFFFSLSLLLPKFCNFCNHQSITQQLKKHRQTKANSWFLNHLHQHTHIHIQTHKTSPKTSNLFFFFLTHENTQFASLLQKHRFKPKPNRFNQKQIETYRIQQTDFRQTDLFLYPFFVSFEHQVQECGLIDFCLLGPSTIITNPNPVKLQQEDTFIFTLQQKIINLRKRRVLQLSCYSTSSSSSSFWSFVCNVFIFAHFRYLFISICFFFLTILWQMY
jgi:hypothetical protein